MPFNMKIFYAMIFYGWFLIGLRICLTTCMKLTWFEAQTKCRGKNKSLTLDQNESQQAYWTGFYKRTSHWMKIIGCYSESALQNVSVTSLSITSPGFCQETCLAKNASLFAVQAKRCVCLPDDFNYSKHQLRPSDCTNTCDNSTLLLRECGGDSAYNIYLTVSDSSLLIIRSHCLSLQCGNDPRFSDISCDQYLSSICSNTSVQNDNSPWRRGMEQCKNASTYLIGNMLNINGSNPKLACKDLVNITSQRWIGVVKDQYIKSDQGELIEEDEHTFFNSCKKCIKIDKQMQCDYENCITQLMGKPLCTETMITTTLPDTTGIGNSTKPQDSSTKDTTQTETDMQTETPLPETTRSNSTKPQNDFNMSTTNRPELQEDSSVDLSFVPVVLVLVLAACVVMIVLYIRRKKRLEDKETRSINKSTTVNTECYSDIDNNVNKNYFVLQKHNPSYELADDLVIQPKVESPYNESEEGTYDHLGDKDARKQPVTEDTYNHASAVMSQDLSDYDVANNKQVHEEENDYDHASPAENSYGHFHTSQKQETDYSELF